MICLKICTFVVSATTNPASCIADLLLWFAWKFVPLWYQQQRETIANSLECSCDLLENLYLCGISNNWIWLDKPTTLVVICLKICTFVVSATTNARALDIRARLWFAWKFVPLWYQQQLLRLINRTSLVVICLKICTFVVSATTLTLKWQVVVRLWFAWKFVPLWYQQQLTDCRVTAVFCCDLLENLYLCGISNNSHTPKVHGKCVVICLKICTFVVSATTEPLSSSDSVCCDLLENLYLCGISNNQLFYYSTLRYVVICLKICTFVVSATTLGQAIRRNCLLWFAWKFVPLWYQQQRQRPRSYGSSCCDLLENLYLCGISNNYSRRESLSDFVVICLKICTFVVSATTQVLNLLIGCCCDLLENLYLCGISNNMRTLRVNVHYVVICLKICTFVVSATTS